MLSKIYLGIIFSCLFFQGLLGCGRNFFKYYANLLYFSLKDKTGIKTKSQEKKFKKHFKKHRNYKKSNGFQKEEKKEEYPIRCP